MAWTSKLLVALTLAGALAGAGGTRAEPIQIVAFGDSNTAGFGVSGKNAYPAQLERALQAKGHDIEVTNGGVSGITSTRALARFEDAIPDDTDIAIVFLGRNDVRWGVDPEKTRANIDAIVRRLRERKIEVILAGFHTRDFADIAATHGAHYYPDFFDGVATDGVKQPKYMLFWDIVGHLNAAGYEAIVERMLPLVETTVLKVFCTRLAEAALLHEPCKPFQTQAEQAEVTATIPTR